jgi:single-strand DNA-binding protein
MAAFNQVILVGNLTQDVQVSYTPNQTAVADTGLAVNESWTAQDGTKREDTLFIDLGAYGKLAEVLAKYTRKGSLVLVQGKIKFERWEDKQGGKHSKHRVVADRVQFLTPNGSRVEQQGDNPDRY